jgi:hypothetical protein
VTVLQTAGLSAAVQRVVDDHVRMLGLCLTSAPGARSIVLLGSAARGEVSAAWVDGRLQLFSDYEFLVITERRISSVERRRVFGRVDALASGFGQSSSLFHVDAAFRLSSGLADMPRSIFTFELKTNGRTIWGPDVLGNLPEVTPENVDLRNTREILTKRLWALLLHTPIRGLTSDVLTDFGRRQFGVACARQCLDVPTVLLPHAGILLPTYESRVAYWRSHVGGLPFGQAMRQHNEFLMRCLEERRATRFNLSPLEGYAATLACLADALAWLARVPGGDHLPDGEIVARLGPALFDERPKSMRQWLAWLAHARTMWVVRGGGAMRVWMRTPTKGHLTGALLDLHGAVLAHVGGEAGTARQRLERAMHLLDPVSVRPLSALDAEFEAGWRSARAQFADAWWRLVRFADQRTWQRYELAMAWYESAVE